MSVVCCVMCIVPKKRMKKHKKKSKWNEMKPNVVTFRKIIFLVRMQNLRVQIDRVCMQARKKVAHNVWLNVFRSNCVNLLRIQLKYHNLDKTYN